mmetsp:Transcript_81719/g.144183  ORF Transcript_81719/g.144183 Transcript_81719/m.144183 type:complete len:100 (-) Transcript_81719:86-385(-)
MDRDRVLSGLFIGGALRDCSQKNPPVQPVHTPTALNPYITAPILHPSCALFLAETPTRLIPEGMSASNEGGIVFVVCGPEPSSQLALYPIFFCFMSRVA